MKSHRYLHYDVFTDQPFSGNQLAVFPEAGNLAPESMQHIANEMNFSETTFVLPAESPDTDVRLRIFTPNAELPMAGHPTVGSTFALAHEGRIAADRGEFVFGLGIGPTPVRLEWNGMALKFAWMTQPLPKFGATIPDFPGLATALGLKESAIRATNLLPQVVSSGVEFLFIPLASRAAVDAAILDRTALQHVFRAAGIPERGVFLFSPERRDDDDAHAYSRMFAPVLGVAEDPATGGASGPLGAYLVHHGVVTTEEARQLVSLQGVAMGRPSRVAISIESDHSGISAVKVGGEAVLIGEGSLRF